MAAVVLASITETSFVGLLLCFACIERAACQITITADTLSQTQMNLTVRNSPGLFNKEQYWFGVSDADPPVYNPHPRCHWTIPNVASNLHCVVGDLKAYTLYYVGLQYCLTPGHCEWIAYTIGFTAATVPPPPKFLKSSATNILMRIDCGTGECRLTARPPTGPAKESTCVGPTKECYITGLTSLTTYTINLSTRKPGFPNWSPNSADVTGRTAFGDLTNLKTESVSTNSATVVWDEPIGIVSVEITLTQQGYAEVEKECKVAGGVRRCIFENLPTSANFSVLAVGCQPDIGGIPQPCSRTQPIYFSTTHAGPSAIIVTEIIWTFARVTVLPPEGLGEPIHSYIVNVTQVGTTQMTSCVIQVKGFCSGFCYVRNLEKSSDYKVTALACYSIDNNTLECIPGKETVSFTSAARGMNMVELIGIVLLIVLMVPAVIVFSLFGHGKL